MLTEDYEHLAPVIKEFLDKHFESELKSVKDLSIEFGENTDITMLYPKDKFKEMKIIIECNENVVKQLTGYLEKFMGPAEIKKVTFLNVVGNVVGIVEPVDKKLNPQRL